MNISKYADYFHDGEIIGIEQTDNKIAISMESSQLYPEWNEDNIQLSSDETIKGKLHLEGIKSIIASHIAIKQLKMLHDTSEILDFDIHDNNKIVLLVTWFNYPPKKEMRKPELIEIEAEKIYWENIPDLLDPIDLSNE